MFTGCLGEETCYVCRHEKHFTSCVQNRTVCSNGEVSEASQLSILVNDKTIKFRCVVLNFFHSRSGLYFIFVIFTLPDNTCIPVVVCIKFLECSEIHAQLSKEYSQLREFLNFCCIKLLSNILSIS